MAPPATPDAKAALRRIIVARRDELPPIARDRAADALVSHAPALKISSGMFVAGYAPIRSELDPRPLMDALATRGARLALPVTVERSAPLVFRAWRPGQPLIAGRFGIHEPPDTARVVVPDVMLLPLVAFDRAGNRLGNGGGYYDRTLAQLRACGTVVAIGIAFAIQEVDAVPALPHDARLHYVLTERALIDCRSG